MVQVVGGQSDFDFFLFSGSVLGGRYEIRRLLYNKEKKIKKTESGLCVWRDKSRLGKRLQF